ncbi:MAG: hypothetical protein LBV79_03865 [Candidatus Adiutrix sp.]|jgi:hypothetical protein|nr:hypothetical protein [Candidatus Adiutrix sp.]
MANNGWNTFIDEAFFAFIFDPSASFLNDGSGAFRTEFEAFGYGAVAGMKYGAVVNPVNADSANHWALALTGNHAFTDDIAMHYGLAYLALNEPAYTVATAGRLTGGILEAGSLRYTDQEKDLGIEADLSFSFQLLDNLQFVTSFGYMFNGDAFKSLRGYTYNNATGEVNAVWDAPDDSYVWYNTLSFSF